MDSVIVTRFEAAWTTAMSHMATTGETAMEVTLAATRSAVTACIMSSEVASTLGWN